MPRTRSGDPCAGSPHRDPPGSADAADAVERHRHTHRRSVGHNRGNHAVDAPEVEHRNRNAEPGDRAPQGGGGELAQMFSALHYHLLGRCQRAEEEHDGEHHEAECVVIGTEGLQAEHRRGPGHDYGAEYAENPSPAADYGDYRAKSRSRTAVGHDVAHRTVAETELRESAQHIGGAVVDSEKPDSRRTEPQGYEFHSDDRTQHSHHLHSAEDAHGFQHPCRHALRAHCSPSFLHRGKRLRVAQRAPRVKLTRAGRKLMVPHRAPRQAISGKRR